MIYEFAERLHRTPLPWLVHAGGPQVLERPAEGERIMVLTNICTFTSSPVCISTYSRVSPAKSTKSSFPGS